MQTAIQSTAELERELQALERETADARAKQQKETARRETLKAEYTSIAAMIARGKERPERGEQKQREILALEMSLEGCAAIIAGNAPAIDRLTAQLREARESQAQERRRKEFEELKARGLTLARTIREKVSLLITQDITQFDDIRLRLGREFGDVGGEPAAREITHELQDNGHQVHFRNLLAAGWTRHPFRHADLGGTIELSLVSMERERLE